MKSKPSSCLILLTLCTSLVLSGRGAAQEQGELKSSERNHTRYRFSDVGSFGGPVSYPANDANRTGWRRLSLEAR